MNTHVGHGKHVCEFGTVHKQCRCMDVARHWIHCPTPDKCREAVGEKAAYAPKHRKETERNFNETRIDQ